MLSITCGMKENLIGVAVSLALTYGLIELILYRRRRANWKHYRTQVYAEFTHMMDRLLLKLLDWGNVSHGETKYWYFGSDSVAISGVPPDFDQNLFWGAVEKEFRVWSRKVLSDDNYLSEKLVELKHTLEEARNEFKSYASCTSADVLPPRLVTNIQRILSDIRRLSDAIDLYLIRYPDGATIVAISPLVELTRTLTEVHEHMRMKSSKILSMEEQYPILKE